MAREAIIAEAQHRFHRRPIKRVLLVQPPDNSADVFDLEAAKRKRYPAFQPNGLLVIAEHLRKNGFEVNIIDLNFLILAAANANQDNNSDFQYQNIWKSYLRQALDGFDPDLVGVSCMFTMTHDTFKEVVVEVKKYKHVPVIIGGVHVTNDVERILRDIWMVDVACTHESEVSFVKFLQFINGESNVHPENITQTAMLIGNSFYEIREIHAPTGEDLNVIPSYDLISAGNYSLVGSIGSFVSFLPTGTKVGTVLTNRGCRAQCTFCSVCSFNGQGVRSRSVETVVDDVSLLYNKFGIRHIMWLDDDLFYNERRAIALFNEIVRHNLKITWDASNGVIASAATNEIITASAESGCIGLHFGIESGNPNMLREMRKPGTVEKFREAALRFENYPNIFTKGFLMLGFPHETLRMMMDTLNLALELDLDWYTITILQTLPSTSIYKSMLEEGLLEDQIHDAGEVKYNVGSYGKQNQIEKRQRVVAANFADEFSKLQMDEVPPKHLLPSIWFYMNYKINFERLKNLEHPLKIKLRRRYLEDITDRIAPGHAIAHFYAAILDEKKGDFKSAAQSFVSLEKALSDSAYWQDKFEAFKLHDEFNKLKLRINQRP